jgi:hypothetical protein
MLRTVTLKGSAAICTIASATCFASNDPSGIVFPFGCIALSVTPSANSVYAFPGRLNARHVNTVNSNQ